VQHAYEQDKRVPYLINLALTLPQFQNQGLAERFDLKEDFADVF
jgi:hypothetical protein